MSRRWLLALGALVLVPASLAVASLLWPSGGGQRAPEAPLLPAIRSVTPPQPPPFQMPPRTLAEVQQQVQQLSTLSKLEELLGPKDRDVPDPSWSPTAVFELDDGFLLVPHAYNSVLEVRFTKDLKSVTRPDGTIDRNKGRLIQRPW